MRGGVVGGCCAADGGLGCMSFVTIWGIFGFFAKFVVLVSDVEFLVDAQILTVWRFY